MLLCNDVEINHHHQSVKYLHVFMLRLEAYRGHSVGRSVCLQNPFIICGGFYDSAEAYWSILSGLFNIPMPILSSLPSLVPTATPTPVGDWVSFSPIWSSQPHTLENPVLSQAHLSRAELDCRHQNRLWRPAAIILEGAQFVSQLLWSPFMRWKYA